MELRPRVREHAAQADARLGMAWWNGLTKPARAMWLDRAWKRASPLGEYSLDMMPSAADAWAAWKAEQRCAECGGTGFDEDAACEFCDGTGRQGGAPA